MVQFFTDLNYFIDELAKIVEKIFTIVTDIIDKVNDLQADEEAAA